MPLRALAVATLLVAICPSSPAAGDSPEWQRLPKPPLRPFTPQQPIRFVLQNGMTVLLQRDTELPLVRGHARIRGGSRDEPAEKAGLVDLFGDTWRTGGTKARTGDALDDFLEARAASVETSGGVDSTTISFDCLKENLDDVFKIFAELIRDPAFREDKLSLAKDELNTGIARRNDNAAQIASREARKLGYGEGSPYARQPEYATVARVTRDDLVSWHARYVHPNNVILGISGDFEPTAMEASVRRAFASWVKGAPAERPKIPFRDPRPGVYFVAKNDVNQTNIRMVHLGTTRDNPDYYAIEVLNQIFGGGFSSRLVSNVRSKKGLAYGVGGGVGTGFDAPGLFQCALGTKSETTAAAIDALYEEIENLKKVPFTEEELRRGKDEILNSFIFRFDSRDKVLGEKMLYEFYGYPPDFMERYRAGVEKVTTADVARVAQKYVRRQALALLVVGKAADFDRPLSTFGPVTTIDVTIPGGEPEEAPPGQQ